MPASIYDYSAKQINGTDQKLADFKDQVLLIVNVASQCGFTPQYKGLETLYEKYKDRGFKVLGFPCNQFGAQEPGNEDEIKNFCHLNYNVQFPLYAKVDVNGEKAHPLWEFLKKSEPGVFGTEAIKWNFTKFLVNRKGEVVARYAPTTTPESLQKEIEQLLQ